MLILLQKLSVIVSNETRKALNTGEKAYAKPHSSDFSLDYRTCVCMYTHTIDCKVLTFLFYGSTNGSRFASSSV